MSIVQQVVVAFQHVQSVNAKKRDWKLLRIMYDFMVTVLHCVPTKQILTLVIFTHANNRRFY